MPTTTVRKGSGRASATEQRNRHAQRTLPPPKAGVVEAAREPIELPGRSRCQICNEDLSTRGLPRHLRAHAERGEKAPSEAVEPPAVASPTDTQTKAHRNAPAFEEAGWTTTVQISGDYAELVAVRGTETIHQAWIGGVYQPNAASYTIGDRTVKTRNVAEAIRWGKRSPDAAEAEFRKVGANKAFVKRAPADPPKPAKLPWDDPETVSEKALADAIAGSKIRWYNRLSQEPEVAIVDPDPHRIRIVEQHGHRVVLFLCLNSGFRAARVSAILSVGKASARQTADMELRAAKVGAKAGRGKRTITSTPGEE